MQHDRRATPEASDPHDSGSNEQAPESTPATGLSGGTMQFGVPTAEEGGQAAVVSAKISAEPSSHTHMWAPDADPPGTPQTSPLPTEDSDEIESDDPLLGYELGNLRIEKKVGQGGWGAVYKATHARLGNAFAIKVLNTPMQSKASFIQRFEREARTLVQLQHENIVGVTDCGKLPGIQAHYLVMEFLEGISLEDALEEGQSFSIARISNLMRQICAALDYIHRKQIVHRDLKPSNIFLVPPGDGHREERVKLIDFGIASIMDETSMTATGVCLGSPKYMSPEQAEGRAKDVDGRADIYASGMMLFELLTGTVPFLGDNLFALIRQQVQTPAPKLREMKSDVAWASSLESLIKQTLAKKPEQRPPDAMAFWSLCETALAQQQELQEAGPSSLAQIPSMQGKRWPIIAFFVALLVVGIGLGVWLFGKKPPPDQASIPARARVVAPRAPTVRPKPEKRRAIVPAPRQPQGSSLVLDARPGTSVWQGKKRLGVVPYTLKGVAKSSVSIALKLRGYRTLRVTLSLPLKPGRRHFSLKRVRRVVTPRRRRPRPRKRGDIFDGVNLAP